MAEMKAEILKLCQQTASADGLQRIESLAREYLQAEAEEGGQSGRFERLSEFGT
jgi:hypothetical protein